MKPHRPASGLATLRNLGPKSAAALALVGLNSRDDLQRAGGVGAYQLLRERGLPVSRNLAYAVEGALMDVDWRALPHEFRTDIVRRIAIYEAQCQSAAARPR